MALKIFVAVSLILALYMAHAQALTVTSLIQVTVNDLRNTANGLPIDNITSPIFIGALAQVQIGRRPLGVGITDFTGSVNIILSPTFLLMNVTTLVNKLVSNGTLRILTPVLNQPTGFLTAPLQLIENNTVGTLNIISFGPGGFNLTA